MHIWTKKDLDSGSKLVQFGDGGIFMILRDPMKKQPTYSLGDMLNQPPLNQGPMTEGRLLATLNSDGAKPISSGDMARYRADHRAFAKAK